MIHVQESSIQSSPLARLHQAGKTLSAILRNSVKTRPGLWFGLAALAIFGATWAIMKVVFASGGGIVLTLLRDAGHQVGSGGLLGAMGAAGGAAATPSNPWVDTEKLKDTANSFDRLEGNIEL